MELSFGYPIQLLLAYFLPFLGNEIGKGAFTIYVDQFSDFLDPSFPIGRPFIYLGLFGKVDIWLTPLSLSLVYIECESPITLTNPSIFPK